MMKTRSHTGWGTRARRCLIAGVLLCVAGLLLCARPASAQMRRSDERTLNGRITDSGREPIRGAVVELRNEATRSVVSYITDSNGRYNFKRLDDDADYQVWVLFRGYRSPTRSISKFDSHMTKVINFTVRTF